MATEDVGDVSVDVVTDFSGFEAQLRRILERLSRDLQINAQVNPDTTAASAQMIRWRRLQEKILDIKVEISRKSLAVASAQIASFTGIAALQKTIGNFNTHITELFTNIIGVSTKIVKLGALAATAATLVGSLFIGLVNVGETLGKGSIALLLAMPAMVAGLAGSVFIFTSAFKDAEAVLGGTLTQYKQLQKTISAKFWEQAAQPMRNLLNNVFPAINEGFAKAGAAAGNFTGRLSEAFQKSLTPARIEGIFGNFAKGFDILAEKAAGPLANVTTNLLEWGSTLMPKLATAFGDMMVKFDGWLDNAIKTGALDKALDDLFKLIKDAWGILKNTWSIFSSIADAAKAAGINAFPLADIMQKIADKMKTPEFQKGLTTFFEGAKRGFEGMKPAFKEFGDLIAAWTPMIAKFMGDAGEKLGPFLQKLFEKMQDPAFMANVQKMLDGMLAVFDKLTPAIGPFVDKLGSLAAFAGKLAEVTSGTLSTGIQKLAPAFGTVLDKMGPLIEAFGKLSQGFLESVDWDKVAGALGGLIDGVTVFLEALNSPVIKFVRDLVIDFITTAISGFMNLAGGVMMVVGGLLKLLSGDWSGLEDIWNGLMKGLEGAWQLFITLFAPAKILGFLGKIGMQLAKVFKLDGLFAGAGPAIGKAFEGIGTWLGKALEGLPSIVGKFFKEMGDNAGKWAGEMGEWIMKGLENGAKAIIGGFLTNVWEPIVQGFKDFFGIASPSTLFMQFGTWIMEGLINGIKALIQAVIDLFTPIVQGVQAGWQALVDFVTGLWNGFVGFITDGWNMIMAVATTVWNTILAVAAAVWAGIQAAIGAVWNFIQAGFNMVLSVAQTVWNTILSVASTVWAAIQAAVAAAIATIQTIIQGIIDFFTSAWNGLVGIAEGVWNSIVSGAQGLASGVMGAISGITDGVAGIFNGVKSTIEGIWNSIQLPNILGGLGIPGFAGGVKNFGGGVAVVGENGPELVMLPKGSDVIPNSQSKSMLSGARPVAQSATDESGGKGFTFAPTIYNPKQETTEQSLFKSAQTISYLGLV